MSNFQGLETIWETDICLIDGTLHCLFNLKFYLITEVLKKCNNGATQPFKSPLGPKINFFKKK